MSRINVLIAGKTGVGKSTLINTIFEKELADTGIGRPVTGFIEEYSDNTNYISLYDSKGIDANNFETINKELENFIKEKNKDINKDNHIHVAWICISDGSGRIEESEINLEKLLSSYVPTVIVITKSLFDSGLSEKAKTLCPTAREVISINSKETRLNKDVVIKPKNIDKLIELTKMIILNNNNNNTQSSLNNSSLEISTNKIDNSNDKISKYILKPSENDDKIKMKTSNDNNSFDNKLNNNNNDDKLSISNEKIKINGYEEKEKIQDNISECEKIIINYTIIMATLLSIKNEKNNNHSDYKVINENKTKLKIEIEIGIIENISNIFFNLIKEKNYLEIKNNYRTIKDYLYGFYEINNDNEKEHEKKKKYFSEFIPPIKLKNKNFEYLLKYYTCAENYVNTLIELIKDGKEITYENISNLIKSKNLLNNNEPQKNENNNNNNNNNNSNNNIFNKILNNTISKSKDNQNIEENIERGISYVDSCTIARATLLYLNYHDKLLDRIEKRMIERIKNLFNMKNSDLIIKENELNDISNNQLKEYVEKNCLIDNKFILKLEKQDEEDIKIFRNKGIKYIDECLTEYSIKNKKSSKIKIYKSKIFNNN